MAANKFYSYYLRGGQIALIEQDINDNNRWKSPASTVADGLEIEYAYSPKYFIETTNDVDQNITQYQSTDGKLSIADNSSAYINYATTYALAADKYIVLRKAGRFNGLHKIHSLSNNTGTNNKITLTTKYSGSEAAWTTFEETPELYYAVDVLDDETDTIDLPEYLAKALVYYVKAKMAEDQRDIELKEYFMREFRQMVEKQESSKVWGGRLVVPASNAIR